MSATAAMRVGRALKRLTNGGGGGEADTEKLFPFKIRLLQKANSGQ